MNQLELLQRQRRLKEHLARSLAARFMVRIHAISMMLGAVVAGWLADWALLKYGLENMLLRYPAAVLVAYVVFLIGAKVWIDRSGIRRYVNAGGAQELLGLAESEAARAPSADREGRDGSWGDWDLFGLFAEPILWLLLAAAAISVVALLLYGTGFYLIAEAEGFFAEIVFGLLLAAGLVRGMRKVDSPGWIGGFVSATWPALFIVVALSLGIGAFAEYRYPGTKTMAELLEKVRATPRQELKQGL